ncbi:MAG: MotA/TolQ/ExbB proton channel family protein [Deltaproteobacteria bacterium]|nr:MotA/TolQ/ExbB proton channel family protein [Deltaproteobacteria bacterium]MBN2671537.1 MotA/TolQ/ExbB proton channel family protein [Deltaproteobacteria bacterium]
MTPDYVEQLTDYLASGGFVMIPLVVLAMVLWFGLGFRLYTLRRGTTKTVRRVIERQRSKSKKEVRGIIPRAVRLALSELKPGVPDIKNRLRGAMAVFDVEMERYSILTKAIVAIAPLLGLLGTVSGMIETFDSLGDMSLFAQSGGIAGGISLALFTTQMGLAVAIPGLLIGRILDQRQHGLQMEIQKIKDIVASMDAHGETL